ncbi:uncharacterized protein LOC126668392 [Mercurialis annua]|uniref:uncharacterized protein LOC126668392 n=1 Tax=Mercurialis annua TaxID=3986 RepID=UPI00215FC35E|nr:uncharacterized protein LOC126668392 [Mercurialis annua]
MAEFHVHDALPKGETLPSSSYEVKKLMRDLGIGYVTIDACVNDCVLFWKENENLDTCPTCKAPRWKLGFGKRKKEKRVDDDTIRHPADATEWKDFDQKYAWFGKYTRNVRLGLASDEFNTFGNMSTSYSMWPVIVTPYNLPPWKCMKEYFLMLSLLIPGKESPGDNIDVYLRPLIDELKELWETGVTTYDAYSAYGMLSGWSTKGKLACPVCNKWTKFDGKPEHGSNPEELSGDKVLRQLDLLPKDLVFVKTPNQKKNACGPEELNWTKRSIFFELPYWKTLKLRLNLDVMHIEKNICENILGTLMNNDGKSKDNIKARMDLEAISIRLPDGYASNLSQCVSVQDCKVMGMKSHDYHIFLQRLLPASICGSLRSEWYVLNNCEDVDEYLKIHIEKLQKESVIDVQKIHQAEFASWTPTCYWFGFSNRSYIYVLGLGPDIRIARYSGIIVNGVRFHTIERDNFRQTQNNEISVTGEHKSKEIEFYGVLTDIIDLQYVNGNHVFFV